MSDTENSDTPHPGPLNLSQEEVAYLWEMMKQEVGKEEVQYGDDRETVESLHTKVRRLYYGSEERNQDYSRTGDTDE